MDKRGKKAGWLIIIPIIFWVSCMGLSVGKMFQTGNGFHIIDWLDVFNSNTFSAYISMVICMAYQFFSVYDKKKQERPGLSRKWIGLTVILAAVYCMVAIINACRYCLATTILMAVVSAIYVFLFFKIMRLKR